MKKNFRALRGQIATSRLYSLPSAVAVPLQNTSRQHCMAVVTVLHLAYAQECVFQCTVADV